MTDYTPTTEEVRNDYMCALSTTEIHDAEAQFDRWLAEVKAEAVIELVARIEAAVILLGDDDITPTGRRMISKVLNPYRQGESSGNSSSQPTTETPNYLNRQGEEQ